MRMAQCTNPVYMLTSAETINYIFIYVDKLDKIFMCAKFLAKYRAYSAEKHKILKAKVYDNSRPIYKLRQCMRPQVTSLVCIYQYINLCIYIPIKDTMKKNL